METPKWSSLNALVTSTAAHAGLVIAIVPYAVLALSAIGLGESNTTDLLTIMLVGSILVLLANGITKLFCPQLISKHKSQEGYADYCILNIESIIAATEFAECMAPPPECANDSIVKKAVELGDLRSLDQRGIQILAAIRTMAYARFWIYDKSLDSLRLACTVCGTCGIILLYWPIVTRIINALLR